MILLCFILLLYYSILVCINKDITKNFETKSKVSGDDDLDALEQHVELKKQREMCFSRFVRFKLLCDI